MQQTNQTEPVPIAIGDRLTLLFTRRGNHTQSRHRVCGFNAAMRQEHMALPISHPAFRIPHHALAALATVRHVETVGDLCILGMRRAFATPRVGRVARRRISDMLLALELDFANERGDAR